MKWLQLRILHRCLGTNVILKEMGLSESELCDFCHTTKDGIHHIFWKCYVTQRFWSQLCDALNEKCQNVFNLRISETLAITGIDKDIKTDHILYFLLLFAKEYIYHCKINKDIPKLSIYLRKLHYRYKIEEYISRKNFMYNDFAARWAYFTPLFNDTN